MNIRIKSSRPLVSLVVNDLAENGFGRAYLLGRMLEDEYRIEVVGFASGPTWPPCADHGWPEKRLSWPGRGGLHSSATALAELAEGDVLLACKALPLVMETTKQAVRRLGSPLIIDIDDWELGWFYPLRIRKALSLLMKTRGFPNSFWRVFQADQRARKWPVRLASNRFLQRRFGGVYIPHACDTISLDPDRLPHRSEARGLLGLPPKKYWIGFIGSPRPHKGVDILLEAVASLNREEIGVLIAGATEGDPEIARLRPQYRKYLEVRPPFPKKQLGEVLAALDLVALPQHDTPAARGQMPAKVFDAMAMKIPVIASAISDLPEVLEGCGTIVPAGDAKALGRAISFLIDAPIIRRKLGDAGRRRCREKYSLKAVGVRLRRLIRKVHSSEI